MSTGKHWGKAFHMETSSSKGSEISLVCRKIGCGEEGHLGHKTVKVRSKRRESCTERVQLGSLGQGSTCSCPLGSPPSSCVSKAVAGFSVSIYPYHLVPTSLKGVLEVRVLRRVKCPTNTGYHYITCTHTDTRTCMHTCTHAYTHTHTHTPVHGLGD